jgi:hypothetical protein
MNMRPLILAAALLTAAPALAAEPAMPQPTQQHQTEACGAMLGNARQTEGNLWSQLFALRDALTAAQAEIAKLKEPPKPPTKP